MKKTILILLLYSTCYSSEMVIDTTKSTIQPSLAIKYLYPDIDLKNDVILQCEDGKTIYIKAWNCAYPKPTMAQIETAWTAYLTKKSIDEDIAIKEKLIQERIDKIVRTQAIYELKLEGKLPQDYK